MLPTKTPKMLLCEQACLDHLQRVYPSTQGCHNVAMTLSGQFCDELVRRALNCLADDGKINMKVLRARGMVIKQFIYKPDDTILQTVAL